MNEAKKTRGSVSFEYGEKGARCVHRESGAIGPWVSMDRPYHETIDAMKDTAAYLSWETTAATAGQLPPCATCWPMLWLRWNALQSTQGSM